MQTTVVTPPGPIIDAATVRSRLGISAATSDADLEAYIAAATQVIDGPDGWLGRALGVQTLLAQGDHFAGLCWGYEGGGYGYTGGYGSPYYAGYERPYAAGYQAIKLYPPVVSVSGITYFDVDGVQQTVAPSAYQLSGRILSPIYNTFWPSARIQPNGVQITYVAGYPAGVPAPILQAIILGVAQMRATNVSDVLLKSKMIPGVSSKTWDNFASLVPLGNAAMALLATYRVVD